MAEPAIDFVALVARTLGRRELADELLTLFCDEVPTILTRLHEAYAAGDGDGLGRGLHRLGGSARTLGADVLAGLTRAAEVGHAAGRPIAFGAIDAEVRRCLDAAAARLRA